MIIDRKKLRVAIEDSTTSPDRHTLLCSIMAHSRGRIHGGRRRVIWDKLPGDTIEQREERARVAATGGSKVMVWTWDDQERYIGSRFVEFVYHDEAQEARDDEDIEEAKRAVAG